MNQELSPEELRQVVREVVERVLAQEETEIPPESLCPATTTECSGCGGCASSNEEASRQLVELGACRLAYQGNAGIICRDLAPFIDHTLLKPNASDEEVARLCSEAITHGFAAVCVNPAFVGTCSEILKGTSVKVCTVVGFPLGATTSEAKAFETHETIMNGADEIDMVMNIGKLKSGDYKYVLDDIRAVIRAAQGRIVKVIIEAASLTDDEKIVACILAKAAGADYVKSSTGFGPGGATARDVAIMRQVVGPTMGVKAAGGIRNCESALEMLKAGATRIGASASIQIVTGTSPEASA